MTWPDWAPELAVAGVIIAVVLAVHASWTAGRLDRLHRRVDNAWNALDGALVRRAAAARALAAQVGDQALDDAARRALEAPTNDVDARSVLESELTRALRRALAEAVRTGSTAADDVLVAAQRVAIARSIHAAAVTDTRAVRLKRWPRALRLAGHRQLPRHVDFDDVLDLDPARSG